MNSGEIPAPERNQAREGGRKQPCPVGSPGSERKVAGVGGRAALRGPLGPAPRALRVCSRAGRPAAANGQSGLASGEGRGLPARAPRVLLFAHTRIQRAIRPSGKAKLNSVDFALESAGPIEMKTYLN
ncbi:hypothetical protein Celaphus_00006452 [Cervus elaphus hippelaphus]|uniref:Uncharacterized protein n=1 Tax=Cervus elaphus hippelaphus TaxID=46360 RepID=A0A212CV08_CEREH|nr:hypothetical protein Celaphus_00006452 [Cervus elaphus hippelaphus]